MNWTIFTKDCPSCLPLLCRGILTFWLTFIFLFDSTMWQTLKFHTWKIPHLTVLWIIANQDPFFFFFFLRGNVLSTLKKTLPTASSHQPVSDFMGFNWAGCKWLQGVLPRGAAYGRQAATQSPEFSRVTHKDERMWRWLYDCRHAWDSAAHILSRKSAFQLLRCTHVHGLGQACVLLLASFCTRSFYVGPRRSLVSWYF